jgi:hypothetical protein
VAAVRDYCETDVLNTWLIYLRFERLRGRVTAEEVAAEEARVVETLTRDGRPHLLEFLAAWKRA